VSSLAANELAENGESCVGLAYDVPAMESDSIRAEHEAATIKAFVVRGRQERFLYLLADPKRRKKFLDELGHFRWFDPRFAAAVPWKVDLPSASGGGTFKGSATSLSCCGRKVQEIRAGSSLKDMALMERNWNWIRR